MGDATKIEWADATFNPWIGCQAISPGCENCYAEAYAKRVGRDFATRTRTSAAYWKQPLKWNATAAASGKPFRVFCASLADVFDNEVPEEWRRDLWDLICGTPNLTWLLLTKRIGNAATMAPMVYHGIRSMPNNVWLGATVVNQEEADRDIPKLLAIPAAVRFLSCEPLLGPIDLRMDEPRCHKLSSYDYPGAPAWKPDWVISGGESGPKARPSHPDWHRSLRDQCADAGVPFLFKQHGEYRPLLADEIPAIGGNFTLVSADDRKTIASGCFQMAHQLEAMLSDERYRWQCPVVRVGKKLAGRTLDGVTHDEFPQ